VGHASDTRPPDGYTDTLKLQRPSLYVSAREFWVVMGVLGIVLLAHLGWEYRNYRAFVGRAFVYAHATILQLYPKDSTSDPRTILKLRTDDGRTLYTTAWRTDLARGMRLYLKLTPGRQISFWDYLAGPYLAGRIRRVDPPRPTLRGRLERWIDRQHARGEIAALYKALYLGSPPPAQLREAVSRLGVSHLVALSGFHLGILWAVLFGVIGGLYRWAQQRFFPWRFALWDVGVMVVVLLGGYVWLADFPPSLVRAFAMMIAGWVVLLAGVELVSFALLATVAMGLMALWPALIVSLGFWLSVAGVFYIFLILKYCQHSPGWLVGAVCVPVGIFVLMQPVGHAFFGTSSYWQLLSPVLSVGFVLFYPLSFVAHLVGQGDLLDGMLVRLLDAPRIVTEHRLPIGTLGAYILLSLSAIRWRRAGYALAGVAAAYLAYVMIA